MRNGRRGLPAGWSHLPGTLRTVVRGRLYALIMPYMHGRCWPGLG